MTASAGAHRAVTGTFACARPRWPHQSRTHHLSTLRTLRTHKSAFINQQNGHRVCKVGPGVPGALQDAASRESFPLKGAIEWTLCHPKAPSRGNHHRSRLTAMRQMPVIAGPPSPVDAAQDRQHCAITGIPALYQMLNLAWPGFRDVRLKLGRRTEATLSGNNTPEGD